MPGLSAVPQPIPYQGSKRQIAPQIISHLPQTIHRLVEPFAGSAAISLAVAAKRRAKRFWLNDAHAPLMDLWRRIIDFPAELATAYEELWHSQLGRERAFFDEIRARFNKSHDSADFLYLLARCVKAAIRYNSKGEFNNTPDKRRKGARPSAMRQRIEFASELLRNGTELTSVDYREVLARCTTRDVVYMDPPYQGVCGDRDQRYLPTIAHSEFCDALDRLNARGVMFAVSYDGRTGDKVYGEPMPDALHLRHVEVRAGRSAQATLLGRDDVTFEAFYLSPSLAAVLDLATKPQSRPLALW
jgi:DNA adenine methylase